MSIKKQEGKDNDMGDSSALPQHPRGIGTSLRSAEARRAVLRLRSGQGRQRVRFGGGYNVSVTYCVVR